MYEFWYDYLKPKYQDNIKLYYMDTDSFIIQINTHDYFKDISNDVIECFDTSNFDKYDNRPLEIGINKAKGTKTCVIKKHLNFDLYKNALFKNETIRCTQQRFKSNYHNIYTQTVHKTALNNKDDKRIQSFDGIHTYSYGIDIDLLKELETIIRNKPIQLYY